MAKYATISVPEHVKIKLEKLKGNRDWGEFLLKLCEEYEKLKREKSFIELIKLLNDEDLKRIEEESKEFRRNFKLGE